MSRQLPRALVATVLTLAACELGLRATDRGPWRPFAALGTLPVMSSPHPELGWVSRPGKHSYPLPEGAVTMSIGDDGCREPGAPGGVTLYGGSFTFGFGVDDDQVLSAELASQRPDLDVRNCAVPGYGTLQSMELDASRRPAGHTVVYGMVELHEGRNSGVKSWLHALDRSGAHQSWGAVPAARWTGDELVRLPPQRYRHWSWSERLALVNLFETALLSVQDRFVRTKAETTVQLTCQWRDAVEARGQRFVVALLDAPSRAEFYLRRLREAEIEVFDLRHPRLSTWGVPGDGHPDARVHHDWGTQLAEAL